MMADDSPEKQALVSLKNTEKIKMSSAAVIFGTLTLILPFATIVVLGGSVNSKACHTYNIPHATIQSKCSYTGVNLLSYKHATFH